MADKGFNIQDILAVHCVRLMAPPMMTKSKISVCASTSTRGIAHHEYIYNSTNDKEAQDFHNFEKTPTLTFKAYIGPIVKVVASLVNHQPCVIKS